MGGISVLPGGQSLEEARTGLPFLLQPALDVYQKFAAMYVDVLGDSVIEYCEQKSKSEDMVIVLCEGRLRMLAFNNLHYRWQESRRPFMDTSKLLTVDDKIDPRPKSTGTFFGHKVCALISSI